MFQLHSASHIPVDPIIVNLKLIIILVLNAEVKLKDNLLSFDTCYIRKILKTFLLFQLTMLSPKLVFSTISSAFSVFRTEFLNCA